MAANRKLMKDGTAIK